MIQQDQTLNEYVLPTLEELLNGSKFPALQDTLLSNERLLQDLLNEWSAVMPIDDFVRLVISLGDCFKRHGDLVQAERMYTLGLAQKTEGCQLTLMGDAYIRRGDVYTRQRRWKNANTDLEQSRRIYTRLNRPVAIGKADNILGITYAARGKMKQARTFIKRALVSFEKFDETLLSGIAHMNLGAVQSLFGDIDGAIGHYHRARSHFEEAGDLARLGELHCRLGTAYLDKSEYEKALCQFEAAGAVSAQCGSKALASLSKLGKANAYYRMGDALASLRLANQVLENISIHEEQLIIAQLYMLKGRIYRVMKKSEFAEWYFRTSLKIYLASESKFAAGECYYDLGVLYSQRGNTADAKREFGRSRTSFKAIGASREVDRVNHELNRVKEHTGDEIRRTRQQGR